MLLVYMSIVGNTKRFVDKLDMPSLEITENNCFTEVDEPYVIIIPTYDIETTDPMNDFIETGDNQSLCRGVIGGGNRNFGKDVFCYTAQDISLDYDVPLLHRFEFMGSSNDVKKVKEIIEEIENADSTTA
ncbi:MAG: class Ib ribonucleoside-diphosphate reductase assembly flavoprotein NrdI [Aerococcus sp.]|nr:class Ib ribonucleoside-diphosphate reductase assembly flavoprotein NrdI [Aerococcus sp.]